VAKQYKNYQPHARNSTFKDAKTVQIGEALGRAGRWLPTDGSRWISCKHDFVLTVFVLSRLFRRLMLEKLLQLIRQVGCSSSAHTYLADAKAFEARHSA
jgi:hypothetical protein